MPEKPKKKAVTVTVTKPDGEVAMIGEVITVEDELSSLKLRGPGGLVEMLREKHPQCKGVFAVTASKDQVLTILRGEKTPEQVMSEWSVQVAKGADAGELDLMIPDADDNDIMKCIGVAAGASEKLGVSATLQLEGLRAERDKARAQLKEAVEEAVADLVPDSSTAIESKDGKTVLVCGVEVPMIGGDAKYIPEVDKDYRFDFWKAEQAAGALKFTQSAGDVIRLLLKGNRISLVGPPSVGKTSMIEQFAAKAQWPITRFNGTKETTVDDFVGCYEARDGSTIWMDGPLVQAMEKGHIFILDDAPKMPADCTNIMLPIMEHGGTLIITANGGRAVKPHPNFRVVLTGNTAGFGDDTGTYAADQVQDAALIDRADFCFMVTWPDMKSEKALIKKRTGITAKLAGLMAKFARDARAARDNGQLTYPVTMRQTHAWAHATHTLGVGGAFAVAVLGKAPASDTAFLTELAQRHLGDGLDGGDIAADADKESE